MNKNVLQQHLYAMPFGTLRIAKKLAIIKLKGINNELM